MIQRDFFLFNTHNSLSIESEDERILDEAYALCQRYEQLFSRVNPESQLYQLNHAGGRPCAVDAELATLVAEALSYCRETEGRYDISMGSVVQLWDFKRGLIPDADAVSRALEHVDYRRVQVRGAGSERESGRERECELSGESARDLAQDGARFRESEKEHTRACEIALGDAAACIDVGGIAKGYIADALLTLFRERGIVHALVNLGGNVAVMGGKPDGSPWRIGIRRPVSSSQAKMIQFFATVALDEGSVVTSGIYERAFTRDGVLYHHILDPKAGFPAQTDLLSATVISKASIDGDGYTTALIIMGADQALHFALEHPEIEVVLVTREGEVLATPGVGTEIPFTLTS